MTDATIKRLDSASDFFIMTPMIKRVEDTLKQWTWCGLTGGVIVGDSRNGKSKAIKSLSNTITSRNGEKIPVFRISIGDRDIKTIRSVFYRIAHTLGHKVKKSDSADDLALIVNIHLSDASTINNTRQVIMIIDEAQKLTIEQLSAFAEIYNDLAEIDVNCTIYFIADENEFPRLAKQLLKGKNKYLRERFFNHVYRFYGLQNIEDVRACLAGYDHFIINDKNGCSATEYYCPVLYQSGWRLTDIAEPLWQIYYEEYKIPLDHTSWNMDQFVRTTNTLLMDYLPRYQDQLNQDITQGIIIRSLEAANIKPSIEQFVASC